MNIKENNTVIMAVIAFKYNLNSTISDVLNSESQSLMLSKMLFFLFLCILYISFVIANFFAQTFH